MSTVTVVAIDYHGESLHLYQAQRLLVHKDALSVRDTVFLENVLQAIGTDEVLEDHQFEIHGVEHAEAVIRQLQIYVAMKKAQEKKT